MDIKMLSFILALVVGGLCYALVKHTADEFDRWYDEANRRETIYIPAAAISLFIVVLAVFVLR